MKILCDTNIILDVLLDRAPFSESSSRVLSLCEQGKIQGFTTASCITDIFYIMHKHLHDTRQCYHALESLLKILGICDVSGETVRIALKQRATDFEDCLVATCAKSISCDYIVTRDRKGFAGLDIATLAPDELLCKHDL